jgi:hypothetical protein
MVYNSVLLYSNFLCISASTLSQGSSFQCFIQWKKKPYLRWLSKRKHFHVDLVRSNDICINLVKWGVSMLRQEKWYHSALPYSSKIRHCHVYSLRRNYICIDTALTKLEALIQNMLSQRATALIYCTPSQRRSHYPLDWVEEELILEYS